MISRPGKSPTDGDLKSATIAHLNQVGRTVTAPRLVTTAGLRKELSMSRSTIEKFVAEGMPCIDISMPDPTRRKPRLKATDPPEPYRRKLAWRFDPDRCIDWLFEHKPYSSGSTESDMNGRTPR